MTQEKPTDDFFGMMDASLVNRDVRVFITNSLGEFYGNEMEFTTQVLQGSVTFDKTGRVQECQELQ